MKVSVLAFDGCMTSAVFGLLDAFNIAGLLSGSSAKSWSSHQIKLVTRSGEVVFGAGGHPIRGQVSLEAARDSDVIVVPPIMGDVGATIRSEGALIAWLSEMKPNPTLIASACTGALLLAEAGLLNERVATTNPRLQNLFERRYPRVRLALEQRIVEDRMVICAGSTTAYLDLAIYIIDRLGGHELAVSTAKALMMGKSPESQKPYLLFVAPRDHGDQGVLRLQEWMEGMIAQPISVQDMTGVAGLGERNLTRRFRNATGKTPMEYLRIIRIETAKRLLESGPITVDRVAEAVGYLDARAFIRAFTALVGVSPARYGRRFR
jgi:transcriptional regulator GlxA family with amidase domain